MSNNTNVVVLAGRISVDAELKYSNSGTAIASFSIAVNKYRSTPDGQGKEEVSFFNCTLFGKAAEGSSSETHKRHSCHR